MYLVLDTVLDPKYGQPRLYHRHSWSVGSIIIGAAAIVCEITFVEPALAQMSLEFRGSILYQLMYIYPSDSVPHQFVLDTSLNQ